MSINFHGIPLQDCCGACCSESTLSQRTLKNRPAQAPAYLRRGINKRRHQGCNNLLLIFDSHAIEAAIHEEEI